MITRRVRFDKSLRKWGKDEVRLRANVGQVKTRSVKSGAVDRWRDRRGRPLRRTSFTLYCA